MRPCAVVVCLPLLACGVGSAKRGAGAGVADNQAGASHAGGANPSLGTGLAGAQIGGGASGGAPAGSVAGNPNSAGAMAGAAGGLALGGAAGSTGAVVGGAAGAAGSAAGGAPETPPAASGILCVFDYDLTLSTNKCASARFDCRTNACLTYNWYEQCMSEGARHAIEECVRRGAYIGIASHANVDLCWADKVAVIPAQMQFPALTGALRYDNPQADFAYPKLDQRSNWNCDTCAYHMNGGLSKPQLIAKVMAHYGMDAAKPADRAKVIFWDDLPDNISKTKAEMPEVHTVHVHENIDGQPNSGGCGILDADVAAGWAPFSP